MLNDFFRINLPYGLARNNNNEWCPFNREYMPLGFKYIYTRYRVPCSNSGFKAPVCFEELPVFTKYKNISDKILLQISDTVEYDNEGKICRIFLYKDSTNPMNSSHDKKKLFASYWNKLEVLSNLKVCDIFKK